MLACVLCASVCVCECARVHKCTHVRDLYFSFSIPLSRECTHMGDLHFALFRCISLSLFSFA